MSTVMVSSASDISSSQVHDVGCSTDPRTVNDQACSGVCGVGPAERTGKSVVTYWPGGRRWGSTTGRRPWKPREIGDMTNKVKAGRNEIPGKRVVAVSVGPHQRLTRMTSFTVFS